MIRLSTLSGYVLAVAAATALFWTSQTVQKAEDRLERVRHDLARERESLHVLRAEWDYLNRPERIEALARKYLKMEPAGASILIAKAGDLPAPALSEAESSVPRADVVADGEGALSPSPVQTQDSAETVATLASLSGTPAAGGRRR
jgi:hypothetical protein